MVSFRTDAALPTTQNGQLSHTLNHRVSEMSDCSQEVAHEQTLDGITKKM
jgi:hypothetical protein